jgi:hypothetical protein
VKFQLPKMLEIQTTPCLVLEFSTRIAVALCVSHAGIVVGLGTKR